MNSQKLLISSHAPFWHNGTSITSKNYNMMLAALPAAIMGIYLYGASALGVLTLSISCAMLWEILMNVLTRRPVSIGDGNAALIGLLFGMLMPAVTPWWAVLIGTFIAVVIGKQIFGGLGCNPFNPVLVAMAILTLSWKGVVNCDAALVNFDMDFNMVYPLGAIKHLGAGAVSNYDYTGLLLGMQSGGIGATFGLGLIIGGIYLILRGQIRWEISLFFLLGVFVTAQIFSLVNPEKYAEGLFHILTGYTLISAFFLTVEDSSSPVNIVPMLLYGAGAGVLTVLIRNIGAFADGAVFAILLMNVANPLLDKIRPRAMGRV